MPDPRPQPSTSSHFAANSISMRTSSNSNNSAVATAGGNGTASARRVRRSWTPAEDHALRTRVAHYGDARGSEGRWKDIASGVPGRTAKDCRKRWFHSLDPSLRKGRWTEDEDRILLEAYSRLGPSWHEIASLIPGRKDDQCSKRYMDILGPSAQKRLLSWTEDEDRVLTEGVRTLGNRWSAIAARLPGRPPLTCRNRWRNLSKQKPQEKDESQEGNDGKNDDSTPGSSEPPFDTPVSSSNHGLLTDLDTLGAMDYPDPGDMGFHELDTLMEEGLDMGHELFPVDGNMGHGHVGYPLSDMAMGLGGGHHVPPHVPDHQGPALDSADTYQTPTLRRSSRLASATSRQPVPPIVHNQEQPQQHHQEQHQPQANDQEAAQLRLRATELAAERESANSQETMRTEISNLPGGSSTTMSGNRADEIAEAAQGGVHVHHHYHHHHYHHYHHHHHHYHYPSF